MQALHYRVREIRDYELLSWKSDFFKKFFPLLFVLKSQKTVLNPDTHNNSGQTCQQK